MLNREDAIERIEKEKLIAIIRGIDGTYAPDLALALAEGGITVMELTLNQKKPNGSIEAPMRNIINRLGDRVLVGAGTILTEAQLDMAATAGAMFIVSPNTDAAVIKKTREMNLVSIPGAMTPSECAAANAAGADFVKLFPAGNLGPGYLKALCAPLNHIKFLVVGGINEKNLHEYAAAGALGFGVGGNLVNKEWVQAGDFQKITDLARAYADAIKNIY